MLPTPQKGYNRNEENAHASTWEFVSVNSSSVQDTRSNVCRFGEQLPLPPNIHAAHKYHQITQCGGLERTHKDGAQLSPVQDIPRSHTMCQFQAILDYSAL